MIVILMATYNGEKYIEEQIKSLLMQTEQNFILYICDDCSTDNTYKLICQYAEKYPSQIVVTQNAQNTGSAKHNFFHMIMEHKQDYIMLCDQDDVWKPDKIALTLQKMKAMEREYGTETPLLVHTDLEVVDATLKQLSPSFQYVMNLQINRTQLKDALVQNVITGCTVMFNRALSNFVIGTPAYMVMHDWWLMLVASAFGVIGYNNIATILYRQHEDNSIGAKNVRTVGYKLHKLLYYKEMRNALMQTYRQAQTFLELYENCLTQAQCELIQNYCAIPSIPKWKRWQTICRLGTFKNGVARRIAQFVLI